MPPTVAALHRYPVKSCRGEALRKADVEPWGLAGDRRWMVVDPDGAAITAREQHRLLLVRPRPEPDGLLLEAPGAPSLRVPRPRGVPAVPVRVWDDQVPATPAGTAADEWFGALLGRPARLVHLADPTRRPTDPRYSRPDDRVSLADGYPLLLTAEESLAALNELVAAGPRAAEGPLPMERFRPNLVVRGAAAWAEDDWRLIRVGGVPFRVVQGCARCVLSTLDPWTARPGKEPLATLARHRRWDGASWFGVNLVPDTQDGRVGVGDEVDIARAVDPGGRSAALMGVVVRRRCRCSRRALVLTGTG